MRRRAAIPLGALLALLLALLSGARAGGPAWVAGASFFDPGTAGTPITWRDGAVSYYTDQGALSPLLSQSDADALVAAAFARWTTIPTAAVAAQRAGQLAEDVNGSNVTVSGGVLLLPADIQESATATPVGVVYDADGQVTDALLGAGAGSHDLCAFHAAYGGPDNFYSDAHFAHALVVVNGNCARSAADLALLRYLLVRALGRVLGMDWSQLNDNVVTRSPAPTPDDWAGFPLMHPVEPLCAAGPVTQCLPDPEQPRADDRAALSRLYPVTAANLALFPGKMVFSETTARIHGRVRFTLPQGGAGQGMQGVNVVARWIDPLTGQRSRQRAAASVSGFRFRGDAGNPATGYGDSQGRRYDRFGSAETALEGFFDLAGLEIPAGSASAAYELSVEAINPQYSGSASVGPYWENAVAPSGTAAPVVVSGLEAGADVEQDIQMTGGASAITDRFEPHTWASPTPVPAAGEWVANFCGYGDPDYHSLALQAGRSLALEVTALDEHSQPTTAKTLPALGLWLASDLEGSPPRASADAFNTGLMGTTRLSAAPGAATIRFGLFDERGDGRPDFRYQARLLYGDTVEPARAGVAGGDPVRIRGMGFRVGTEVEIAGAPAPLLEFGPNQLLVSTPALSDGAQTITLRDPETGATAEMTGALTYGAGAGDLALFLTSNGNTPVGGQAANPVRVRVTQADGVTPVPGATVTLSATPSGSIFSACGGVTCRLVTDGVGEVTSLLTVKTSGSITLRATLATGAYATSTLSGTTSSLAISALSPSVYAATSADITWPLPVRVLANGSPAAGRQVKYTLLLGSGTLSASLVTTNAAGEASSTLTATHLAGRVQVAACIYPAGTPCTSFNLQPVADSALAVQKIAGEGQIVTVGQSFQPLTVRVTDSSSPGNPVRRASVRFEVTVMRWEPEPPPPPPGDNFVGRPVRRIGLGGWTATAVSDDNGVATLPVALSSSLGAVEVSVRASAGAGEAWFTLEALWPVPKKQ